MQRRKERGNDGRVTTKGKRQGTAPDEITRGRGESPDEQEMQDETQPGEVLRDYKNDRRERRRERHE